MAPGLLYRGCSGDPTHMHVRNVVWMSCIAAVVQLGCSGISGSDSARDGLEDICINGQRIKSGSIPSTGPVPANCVRIEGADIGADVEVQAGNITVSLESWVAKGGSNEFVGFTIGTSGSVAFAVKAGTKTYYGGGTSWVHPIGTSGSTANAISNITFCEVPGTGADAGTPSAGDAGTPTGGDAGTPTDPEDPCNPGTGGGTDGGVNEGGAGGTPCINNSQCASATCVNGTCLNETGGSNQPGGTACTVNANCASLTCEQNVCLGEVSFPPGQPNGSPCSNNSGCASETCVGGICVNEISPPAPTPLPDGAACSASSECRSQICFSGTCLNESSPRPVGAPCTAPAQCQTNACDTGICVPIIN